MFHNLIFCYQLIFVENSLNDDFYVTKGRKELHDHTSVLFIQLCFSWLCYNVTHQPPATTDLFLISSLALVQRSAVAQSMIDQAKNWEQAINPCSAPKLDKVMQSLSNY